MFDSYLKIHGKEVCSIIVSESKEKLPNFNSINTRILEINKKPLDHKEILNVLDAFLESDLVYEDFVKVAKAPRPSNLSKASELPEFNCKLTSRNTPICLCGSKNLNTMDDKLLGGIVYFKCCDCKRLVS